MAQPDELCLKAKNAQNSHPFSQQAQNQFHNLGPSTENARSPKLES